MRLLSQQLPCQRRQTAASKRLFHCLKCTWSTWSGNVHLQSSNKESPFNMLFSITRLHNSTWELFVDRARGTHWRHFGGGMKLAGALHRSPVVSAIHRTDDLKVWKTKSCNRDLNWQNDKSFNESYNLSSSQSPNAKPCSPTWAHCILLLAFPHPPL
jgi:hypothetical protein